MNAQTFRTPAGEEMVVLSRADYDALIARLEELEEDAEDAEAARAAKAADDGRRHVVSPDQVRGHYLRMRRKTAGLTQTELATRAELAQGYISDLEAGRRKPSADVFARIAHALGIGGDELESLKPGYGIAP